MVFLFLLGIIIVLLIFSKIRIELTNLQFSSTSKKGKHIKDNYKIIIQILVLKKIPIFKINITKNTLEKIKIKEKLENIEGKFIKNKENYERKIIQNIKNLKIEIKNIYLKIEIGTENAALTAISVPVISAFCSFFFRENVKKYNNQFFCVNPIYINKNMLNVLLEGTFEIKVIHIINML